MNQELDLTSPIALTQENGDYCNKSQSETEFLEPIFADVPSVSHKYTTRMKDFRIIDTDIDFDNPVDVKSSSKCNHSVFSWFNIFRICEICATPIMSSPSDDATVVSDDATVVPESSTNYINWMKSISQNKPKPLMIILTMQSSH